MPVSKYRSVADMPAPAIPSASALVARIRALWQRSFLLAPPSFPRGVARFRDQAEANDARAQATLRRMRDFRRDDDG